MTDPSWLSRSFPHLEKSMEQQNNEQAEAINWGRRLGALAGILLIAVGQYVLSVQPVDDTKMLPGSSWIILLGVGLLIISIFMRPEHGYQQLFVRLKLSEAGFGVFIAI